MEKNQKLYLRVLLISQIIVFIAIFIIVALNLKDMSNYNKDILNALAISETKNCMKQTINNTIVRIDTKRNIASRQAKDIIDMFEKNAKSTEVNNFYNTIINRYAQIKKNHYGTSIQLKIIDTNKDKIIFSSEVDESVEKELFVKKFIRENYLVYLYTRQSYIDDIVKKEVHYEIHNSTFEDNEYIWVNEVLKYSGGDDYAIRVIHPNLVSSEGMKLSTNMVDIVGNYPYLKELEGIKADGEIIQTYYFKNKSDNHVKEKLSYAKLYGPFNWIVATGRPIDDILSYTNKMQLHNKNKIIEVMIELFVFMILMFMSIMGLIIKLQEKHVKDIDEYIKIETELDLLTGAFSRKYAEVFLSSKLYMNCGNKMPLFIMIDIDNFKNINDTYGHDVGDIVLKRVTKSILSCIKEEDRLFRWGGEEFLIVCQNIDENEEVNFAEKILSVVNSIVFEANGNFFKTSISMGGAYMDEENPNYSNIIKLADEALYKAKHTGKNRYCNSKENRK